jgi:hypothetical protein
MGRSGTVEDGIQQFLDHLQVEREMSPNTVAGILERPGSVCPRYGRSYSAIAASDEGDGSGDFWPM